jgi:hypothetical protein
VSAAFNALIAILLFLALPLYLIKRFLDWRERRRSMSAGTHSRRLRGYSDVERQRYLDQRHIDDWFEKHLAAQCQADKEQNEEWARQTRERDQAQAQREREWAQRDQEEREQEERRKVERETSDEAFWAAEEEREQQLQNDEDDLLS